MGNDSTRENSENSRLIGVTGAFSARPSKYSGLKSSQENGGEEEGGGE